MVENIKHVLLPLFFCRQKQKQQNEVSTGLVDFIYPAMRSMIRRHSSRDAEVENMQMIIGSVLHHLQNLPSIGDLTDVERLRNQVSAYIFGNVFLDI